MGIKVFEHANFEGINEYFAEGFFNVTDYDGFPSGQMNIQNDSISSFILDPYTRVTFYWDINRGGTQWIIENNGGDQLKLGYVDDFWNDQISSIEVVGLPGPGLPNVGEPTSEPTQPGLLGGIVFEDWHYNQDSNTQTLPLLRPRSQFFAEGEYILPYEPELSTGGRIRGKKLGVRPKSISSVKIGTDFAIDLYDDAGNSVTVTHDLEDIRLVSTTSDWNDRAVKLLVRRKSVPR
jgi:hypothetical protein